MPEASWTPRTSVFARRAPGGAKPSSSGDDLLEMCAPGPSTLSLRVSMFWDPPGMLAGPTFERSTPTR